MLVEQYIKKGRKKRSQNAKLVKIILEEIEANLDGDAFKNSNYVIETS